MWEKHTFVSFTPQQKSHVFPPLFGRTPNFLNLPILEVLGDQLVDCGGQFRWYFLRHLVTHFVTKGAKTCTIGIDNTHAGGYHWGCHAET